MYNSAIHKAADLTVPGRSMISTGTIPVEQKSVHWLWMGATSRNSLLGGGGVFWLVFFWEWPVTKEPAALWIALYILMCRPVSCRNEGLFTRNEIQPVTDIQSVIV